jgi:hypothetical protein
MPTVSAMVASPNTKLISARGTEQRLHRLEEHAEGVERAERQIDDGRGEESGGAAVAWAHGIRINAAAPCAGCHYEVEHGEEL